MEEVFLSSIPLWIKENSDFYKSLEDKEKNLTITIPKNSMKEDSNISSLEDFITLFNTIRFFAIDYNYIENDIYNFINLNKVNIYYIKSYLHKLYAETEDNFVLSIIEDLDKINHELKINFTLITEGGTRFTLSIEDDNFYKKFKRTIFCEREVFNSYLNNLNDLIEELKREISISPGIRYVYYAIFGISTYRFTDNENDYLIMSDFDLGTEIDKYKSYMIKLTRYNKNYIIEKFKEIQEEIRKNIERGNNR